MMRFKITYVNPHKPPVVVGPERFENSSAFFPVLQLKVGEAIERRYTTAGYKRIERVA